MSIRFKIIKLGNFHTTSPSFFEGVHIHNQLLPNTASVNFLLNSLPWADSRFLTGRGWFSSQVGGRGGGGLLPSWVVGLGHGKWRPLDGHPHSKPGMPTWGVALSL